MRWPELLPLCYLVLTSTVMTDTQAPSVSIGFGTLYLTDVLLLLSFGYVTVLLTRTPHFTVVRTPIDWPLLIFWGAALISTFIAIADSSLPWKQTLHEIRVVAKLLTVLCGHEPRAQQETGHPANKRADPPRNDCGSGDNSSAFVRSFADPVRRPGQSFDGVPRIIPPGQSVIMVAFTAVFATVVLERQAHVDSFSVACWPWGWQ